MHESILAAAVALALSSNLPSHFVEVIGGPKRDRGVHVSPTRDGGFIAVGVTKSFGQGKDDVYLVRTDAEGELLWSQTFGGTENDNGWSVSEVRDGFIVSGYTNSLGAGGFDFYLIKTDPQGELEWSETYGGKGDEYCWALVPALDGGFVLVGETTSSGAGQEDVLLIKTDRTGALLWSRTYGGPLGDRCFSVARAPDGGYMLAGQTYSEGAGDRDAYVIKTAADGEMEWSRTFGGAASDVGHYIAPTSDDEFLVTGYTSSFAVGGDDPYLIKIDMHGDSDWERALPMKGVNRTLTGEQATDGGFFLVGFSQYPAQGTSAALVVKTERDGRLYWYRDVLPTSSGETFGYTVRATRDGGCVFTGHTTVGSAGNRDLLLVKVK